MNDHLAKLITEVQWAFIEARIRFHLASNLYGNGNENLIDELSQEVTLCLLRHLDCFETDQPDILIYKVLKWIHEASRLKVLEWFRNKRREEKMFNRTVDIAEVQLLTSVDQRECEWPAESTAVSTAVESLPPRMRTAVLAWMNGEEINVTAKRMKCRRRTVQAYVSRGLAQLSESLKRKVQ